MKNYKVILEYDGSFYNGLQKQKSHQTIYSVAHNALLKVFNGDVSELNFCGRTDSGVHAFGQVLNVKTNSSFVFPGNKLALGINYHLRGEQISAISSSEVDLNFHARYSCLQRIYKYIILNRSFKSPLYHNKAWLVPYKIDILQLQDIAKVFVGTFNFSHFRNNDCQAKSPIRTVDFINLSYNCDMIEIQIASRSFLYNMVRSIVGAVVDVARGRIELQHIINLLENPDLNCFRGFQVAPSCGLYFMEAKY